LSALELRFLAAEDFPSEEEEGEIDGCQSIPLEEARAFAAAEKAQYEVVYKPFVAIRSRPSTDGKIVGTVMFQQRLDTFGFDQSRCWRRVFGRISGEQSRLVEAWVLLGKPGVGALLEAVPDISVPRLPEGTLQEHLLMG